MAGGCSTGVKSEDKGVENRNHWYTPVSWQAAGIPLHSPPPLSICPSSQHTKATDGGSALCIRHLWQLWWTAPHPPPPLHLHRPPAPRLQIP